MANEALLKKISEPVDAAAAAQASEALAMQWGNLRGIVGMGLPENPGDGEFKTYGLELVQTGKVTVTLTNGDKREFTIAEIQESMRSLARATDDEAVRKSLEEEAERLEKLKKSSSAMGKIKSAMADAAEENSGSLFGLSFGNAIGGLFSYLGKLLSWVFSGFKGEAPGFRATVATYAANNLKRSTYERLNAMARTDPEVAAVLTTRGEDGKLVIDTLADGMRTGALKEGGVIVDTPPPSPKTYTPGDISGPLRLRIGGANEFNARQIAAVALGAEQDDTIRRSLQFNMGGRKVDLNYGPVQSVLGFVRSSLGYSLNADQAKLLQEAVGKRVAKVLDEKADEYAAMSPAQRKTFLVKELKEELAELKKNNPALAGMPDEAINKLAEQIAIGITDPSNEKHFRLLPKEAKAPAVTPVKVEPGGVATPEQVFNNLAEYVKANTPDIAKELPTLPQPQKDMLDKSQSLFVETAARVVKDNPDLLNKPDELAAMIKKETADAMKKEFKTDTLDPKAIIILDLIEKQIKRPEWIEQIRAATQGRAADPSKAAVRPKTPDELAADFADMAKTGMQDKLTAAFDPKTSAGKFLREVFERRNPGKKPDAAALANAVMADPEIAKTLVEGGDLVKLKPGATPDSKDYAVNDKDAFLSLNHRVNMALKDQVPDSVMRQVLSDQITVGLLEQKRPGFKAPSDSTVGIRTLMDQEVDKMLRDGFESHKMAALKPALQARNGGKPIDFDKVREKIRPITAKMLIEDRDLPPAEFQAKLDRSIRDALCKGKTEDGQFHNDCGFTDPAIIVDLSSVVSAQATEKIHGAGAGNLALHERNLLTHIIAFKMNGMLNTDEGRRILDMPGTEGLRDASNRDRLATAFAEGLQDLNNGNDAINKIVAEKNAQSPGSGDRWSFDHAVNVMNQKIKGLEDKGLKISPEIKRSMIDSMLRETRGSIPGGDRWNEAWLNEGKLELVKNMIRSKLNGFAGAEKALNIFGGIDRVAPVVMEPGFMEKSTEEKRVRLHQALGVGVPGADTAAFVLAYGIDGKPLNSTSATVKFVADKPMPFVEVTPRQVVNTVGHGLNQTGQGLKRAWSWVVD